MIFFRKKPPAQPPAAGDLRSHKPLRVAGFTATRAGDADRGPEIRMRAEEAAARLLADGELVYVSGPRRKELAVLRVDDAVPRGDAHLRDVAGVSVSEVITVHKPDFDRPPRGHFA